MGNAEGRRSDVDENVDENEMFPSPLKISVNASSSGKGDVYTKSTSSDDIVKASIPINSTLSVRLYYNHSLFVLIIFRM